MNKYELGLRMVSLGDIFTDSQLQGVLDIINQPDLEYATLTEALKEYMQQFAGELEAKEIDVGYMAYLLTDMAPQWRAAAAKRN